MSYIISLGTAVPPYSYKQEDTGQFMTQLMGWQGTKEGRLLRALYRRTCISQRHFILPDFHLHNRDRRLFPNSEDMLPMPSLDDRLDIYRKEAGPLVLQAIEKCKQTLGLFEGKSLNDASYTHLITVSCTGLHAPGLEFELVKKMGLRPDITRYAVNFMGCYAAFHALKLANTICLAEPEACVLIASVELCSLHFQKATDQDTLMANALFADGAASAIVVGETFAQKYVGKKLHMDTFLTRIMPQGEKDMSWRPAAKGFLMTLSAYIPRLVEEGIPQLVKEVFSKLGLTSEAIHHWGIHPGGRKILDVCQKVLNLSEHALEASYGVLASYGNMSAPTILFVLREIWEQQIKWEDKEKIFLTGFGPGLTMEAAVLSTA